MGIKQFHFLWKPTHFPALEIWTSFLCIHVCYLLKKSVGHAIGTVVTQQIRELLHVCLIVSLSATDYCLYLFLLEWAWASPTLRNCIVHVHMCIVHMYVWLLVATYWILNYIMCYKRYLNLCLQSCILIVRLQIEKTAWLANLPCSECISIYSFIELLRIQESIRSRDIRSRDIRSSK